MHYVPKKQMDPAPFNLLSSEAFKLQVQKAAFLFKNAASIRAYGDKIACIYPHSEGTSDGGCLARIPVFGTGGVH